MSPPRSAVNEVVVAAGSTLKVIFENDYLQDTHIVRLCQICSETGVAFVKTSTGSIGQAAQRLL